MSYLRWKTQSSTPGERRWKSAAIELYTLVSGVVAASDVRQGTPRYTGGSNGTAYIPAATDVRFGVNVDATTGLAYIPAAANVRFGIDVDATTGTCHVPAEAETLYGIAVDVSGTGTVTLPNTDGHTPDAALVSSLAHFGPGNATAGTLDLSLYVLISAVVDASWVVIGHDNYVGGSAGTYPTTATSKAEQLVVDQGVVLAAAASIKDDATILGQAGTYDFTAAIAAGYNSGLVDQLAADVIAVNAGKAGMTTATTILTVTGTLDMTLYTLISGVVDASFVLVGHDNYTGGSPGTYPSTAAAYASGLADQLAADTVLVTAAAPNILNTCSLLGVLGLFDLSLWTLTGSIGISVIPSSADPFSRVLGAIWAALEASPDFCAAVLAGNRIKITGTAPIPRKETIQDSDLPEVIIAPTTGAAPITFTSTSAEVRQNYRLEVTTGSLNTTTVFQMKWIILRALIVAGQNLGLKGLVAKTTYTDFVDLPADAKANRGLAGWVMQMTISVDLWLSRAVDLSEPPR